MWHKVNVPFCVINAGFIFYLNFMIRRQVHGFRFEPDKTALQCVIYQIT